MNRYIVPELSGEAQVDRRCVYCGSCGSVIHGHRMQSCRDPWLAGVRKTRMRCVRCGKTWTLQPSGVRSHAQRSDRVKVANVLLCALGLSYRGVCGAMSLFRVVEDKMSVYRDVQSAGSRALSRLHGVRRQVRVAGIDGTGQRLAEPGNPHTAGLVFVVDFGDGGLLEVDLIDEADAAAISQLIGELEERYGIRRWVSDQHGSYTHIPWSRHELCTAHFKKSKLQRLREIERELDKVDEPERGQLSVSVDILRRVLKSPPARAKPYLGRLHDRWAKARPPTKGEQETPSYKMRQLILEVWNNWDRVWNYTNNATERAIGRTLKVRSKTMRGFKRPENIRRFVALSEYLRQHGQRDPSLLQLV